MSKLHLRFTSALLVLCMIISMMPMHVFASEMQEPTTAVTEPVTVTEIPMQTEEPTEGETQPPATDAAAETTEVTEPVSTEAPTEPEETVPEETVVEGEEVKLLLADEDALAAALQEAKAFIDGLTLNHASNVPATVVSTWKSQFTWDNEKRETKEEVKRTSSKKWNLSELDGELAEGEALSDAEQVELDMMKLKGNQLNYMV